MDVKKGKEVSTVLASAPPEHTNRVSVLARLIAEYHLRARSDLLADLLIGVIALLFAQSHAVFGVYPFAIALLASLRRHVFPAFLGAAIGCWFLGESGVLYLAVYAILLVLRALFSYIARKKWGSEGLFAEPPIARVLQAALVGCMMSAYELALFGIYDYTVLFALGTIFLPSLLTFAFSLLCESHLNLRALFGKEPYRVSLTAGARWVEAAGILFLFSIAFSFRKLEFFGVSVANCVITLFVLLIAKRFGALRGCAAGLLLSLAQGVSFIPAFGLLGLLSGVYQTIGMPCALAAAILAAGGYAVYVDGLAGFLTIVPEMAITALLVWPFLKNLPRAEDHFFTFGTDRTAPSAPKQKPVPKDNGMADAYHDIAKTLAEAAEDESALGEEEYATLCRRVKDGVCRHCAHAENCKQEEIVLRALAETGCSREGDAAGGGCEAFSQMTEKLRTEAADLLQKKRLGGSSGAFCTEYALHARLLRENAQRKSEEETEDQAAASALAELLRENGIAAEGVSVIGKRRRQVTLTDVRWHSGAVTDEHALRELCAKVCGSGLDDGQISYNGKRINYRFESEEKFEAQTAIATAPGRFGAPSGDRARAFASSDGMAFAALCDGMGSGKRAAHASDICLSVLSSLLSCGAERETVLSLLGNLLCAADEECSVALDLLSVDLINGRASFLKSGAAASFVKREDALYRIRAKTIPMGVFREVDSEEVHLELADGDLLILLSDGVMHGNEDGGWLKELLRETLCDNLSDLARTILAVASERAGADRDDMTVVLTRIGKKGVPLSAKAAESA